MLFFFFERKLIIFFFFFFSSRRRHTRCGRDWSSDVCSSDLRCQKQGNAEEVRRRHGRVHDAPEQAPLHGLERLRLQRAQGGVAVIDEQTRQIEQARHPGDHADDVEGLRPGVELSQPRHRAPLQAAGLTQQRSPAAQIRPPPCDRTGVGDASAARTRSANPSMKGSVVPTVGTLMYAGTPDRSARCRYSMSSSTSVSECSDTKAIGNRTTTTFSSPARLISASVDGPIHSSGPTRLW